MAAKKKTKSNVIPMRRKKVEAAAPPVTEMLRHIPEEIVAVGSLKAHPKNYKNHPDEQLAHIESSLKQHGYYKNVVVARDGTLLAGHGVWEGAKKVGATTIPIKRVDLDPDHPEAIKILIADNEISRLATTNDALLLEGLRAIKQHDIVGLLGTGFDDQSLRALIPAMERRAGTDEPPPLPTTPESKLGDLYILGRHRLLCGSSTNKADLKRLMGDERSMLLWTDAPYNVGIVGGWRELSEAGRKAIGKKSIENDAMGEAEFRSFLLEAFGNFDEYMPPGAIFYATSPPGPNFYDFEITFRNVGWKHAQTIMWLKDSFVLGRSDYHWIHEPMLYGWKPGAPHKRVTDRTQSSVWPIPRPKKSEEHPTMKPTELVERSILNSSEVDDVVLDGFGGSGTTLIAAEKTQRRARLMELDPKYVDVIVKRWETMTGEKSKRVRSKVA